MTLVDLDGRDNRRLLRQAMESAGFRTDKDEWWYFDYGTQLWAAEFGYSVAIYGEK
ncbi:M15 family metallopeptidase [Moritella sp. JT01]|uniref:M15 family metallopeptidase n=1 Tax=Moritella sp. JT01 TaxID=756698 RepID=UPI0012F7A4EA|nr:M15 family metallopeptidase [Moritella sp. JT01]